jgi:hypothetical protein
MMNSINAFLVSQKPDRAQQFIISVFAEWAEREFLKKPDKFNKAESSIRYLQALQESLNSNLSHRQMEANRRKNLRDMELPSERTEEKKQEVVTYMETLTPIEAELFLAETTALWCQSIPESERSLIPITPRDGSDKAFADAVHEWFVRYFELWS